LPVSCTTHWRDAEGGNAGLPAYGKTAVGVSAVAGTSGCLEKVVTDALASNAGIQGQWYFHWKRLVMWSGFPPPVLFLAM